VRIVETNVICFECHRRVTEAELKAGLHNHADRREELAESQSAASSGEV
jgi:hypothetical protein